MRKDRAYNIKPNGELYNTTWNAHKTEWAKKNLYPISLRLNRQKDAEIIAFIEKHKGNDRASVFVRELLRRLAVDEYMDSDEGENL